MNIVDSSGWLEYFADGPNAPAFLPALRDTASLLVPGVTVYEVIKVILRESTEHAALEAVAAMQKSTVLDVTTKLALAAARLSLRYKLPMADSLILATAQTHGAIVWTQDADFRSLPGVKYFAKKGK
jgi:predicted nucleic acid-binding protein